MLGWCYRDANFVVPTLNDAGAAYLWRLEADGRTGSQLRCAQEPNVEITILCAGGKE
jgi:hypothetical protein